MQGRAARVWRPEEPPPSGEGIKAGLQLAREDSRPLCQREAVSAGSHVTAMDSPAYAPSSAQQGFVSGEAQDSPVFLLVFQFTQTSPSLSRVAHTPGTVPRPRGEVLVEQT